MKKFDTDITRTTMGVKYITSNIVALDKDSDRKFAVNLFFDENLRRNFELRERTFWSDFKMKLAIKREMKGKRLYAINLRGLMKSFVEIFLEEEYNEKFREGEIIKLPFRPGILHANTSDHYRLKDNAIIFVSSERSPYLALVDALGDEERLERFLSFLTYGVHPKDFKVFVVSTFDRSMSVYAPSPSIALGKVHSQLSDNESMFSYNVVPASGYVNKYYRTNMPIDNSHEPRILVYDVDERGLPKTEQKTYLLTSLTLLKDKDNALCPATNLFVRARSEEEANLLVRVDYYEKDIEELFFKEISLDEWIGEGEVTHSEKRGLLRSYDWEKFFESI